MIPCSTTEHVRQGMHLIEDAFEEHYRNGRDRTSAAGGSDLGITLQERQPQAEPRERPHCE